MSKRTQTSKKVLWKTLSDKQAESTKGGYYYSHYSYPTVDEWCNHTKKMITYVILPGA